MRKRKEKGVKSTLWPDLVLSSLSEMIAVLTPMLARNEAAENKEPVNPQAREREREGEF